MILTPKEERAVRFALVYGTDKISPAVSDEEAKERLALFDATYKKTAAVRSEVRAFMNRKEMKQSAVTYGLGAEQPGFHETIVESDEVELTIVRYPKCLYCTDRGTVSCFVDGAKMFLQITCDLHIPETAIIMWRKNGE